MVINGLSYSKLWIFLADEDNAAEATLVQPKFIPTGPIKNPVARGKPQL
jgi:hypothetical protein